VKEGEEPAKKPKKPKRKPKKANAESDSAEKTPKASETAAASAPVAKVPETEEKGEEKTKPVKKNRPRKPKKRDDQYKTKFSDTILFFGNLPPAVDDEVLLTLLANHGCTDARVRVRNEEERKRIGYGKFTTPEECTNALEKFQGAKLNDVTLVVRRAFAHITMEGKPQ
jgi:RNA recognition motif-containing protein